MYGQALRSHRGIENSLQYQLAGAFDEDRNRISTCNGAENLRLLSRLALSLLQVHPAKRGIVEKRFAAAMNPDFLEELLRNVGTEGNR